MNEIPEGAELLPRDQWTAARCGKDFIVIGAHVYRGYVWWTKVPTVASLREKPDEKAAE